MKIVWQLIAIAALATPALADPDGHNIGGKIVSLISSASAPSGGGQATAQAVAQAVVVLVPEQVQGVFTGGPWNIPAGLNPSVLQIDVVSTVFPTDRTLSVAVMLEGSYDNGATWVPESGFPASNIGGFLSARRDGLLHIFYYFDGTPRKLRAMVVPYVNGAAYTPPQLPPLNVLPFPTPYDNYTVNILQGSVPGSYDWGLTATVI